MSKDNKNSQTQQSCLTDVSGSTLICDCDLSIRTKKLFENAGLKKVEDILQQKLSNLLKYRGFGKQSLSEIRGFVIKYNLCFDND
jgi:DNA-directed RNA polymerase alpha subunit